MVAASADDILEVHEWDAIVDTLFQKRMFDGMDLNELVGECIDNLKHFENLAEAVNDCAPLIQSENENIVFQVAVDIVLIEIQSVQKNKKSLNISKKKLAISDDFAMKAVEVMLARNFGNAA